MSDDLKKASTIVDQFGLPGARVSPLGHGLINRTFLVQTDQSERFVLQQVNAIFPTAINRDIDALTKHLAAHGLPTPEIVSTKTGHLWVNDHDDIWRLLTFIEGQSHDALTNTGQAFEAGKLLARFHHAASDLNHKFANLRLGVHDTARHLQALEKALVTHTAHRCYLEVADIAGEILEYAKSLPALPETPDRIVHGDPKINNILFEAGTDKAICLVDLDTITRMPLPLELGDAFRSWCNPAGEDERAGEFSSELFAQSLAGYREAAEGWITSKEWSAILPATETILVELAARFCADALNESYFGWDPESFAGRSEHNQVRAMGQLSVARSLVAQKPALQTIVDKLI